MSPNSSKCAGVALLLLASLNVANAQNADVLKISNYLKSGTSQSLENAKKAEALCREGLKAQPGNAELTTLLVEALVQQERLAEVPDVLTAAIDIHPRESELILKRAMAFASLGKTDEVISDCLRLNQLGEGRGFVLAAQAAEAQGDSMSALRCYTRLLTVFPDADDRASWQFSRAKYFAEFGLFDWAESDINASLKTEWEPLKALLLGEVLARQQRWEEAEAAIKTVFDRVDAGQHFIAELRRLRVLMDMDEREKVSFLLGKYDEKYKGTEKLKKADEIRAALAARLKSIEEQIQAAKNQNRPSGFETAEESANDRARMQQLKNATKPAEVAELKRLLIRHAQFGMESEEAEYAKVMLKLLNDGKARFRISDPDAARMAAVEAWLKIQADDYRSAQTIAKSAVQKDPGFGDARRMLGLALYMQDDNRAALASVTDAITADPLNASSLGLRALIQTELGDPDQAAKDLLRATGLSPNNPSLGMVKANFFRAIENAGGLLRNHCRANPGNTLARCELLLELEFPALAVQDAQELRQHAEDSDKPRIASIMAKAAYLWFTQTMQYETGGPTAEQVVDVCLHAWELNPDNAQFAAFTADALRFQGRYSLSAMWTERALQKSPKSASLLYQLASLKLAEGDLAAAKAASAKMQAAGYQDDESVGLRNEIATVVAQAEDLAATLDRMKFRSETGTALQQLLATKKDTARAFDSVHAKKLDEFYTRMRPQAAGVTAPDKDTILRMTCLATYDLKSQDNSLLNFDEQLAGMAPKLKDGHFWFTVKYTPRNEILGKKFAYFVKLKDGWKVFPQPWGVD